MNAFLDVVAAWAGSSLMVSVVLGVLIRRGGRLAPALDVKPEIADSRLVIDLTR